VAVEIDEAHEVWSVRTSAEIVAIARYGTAC
jgi:hypothetical protein